MAIRMGGRVGRRVFGTGASWPSKPYVLVNIDFSSPKRHSMLFVSLDFGVFVCFSFLLVLGIESSFTCTEKCSTIELHLTPLYFEYFEVDTSYVVQAGLELAP